MGSAGRCGALSGSPPSFVGMLPTVEPQAASAHTDTSANATRGAKRMRRAFDIIQGQGHTAMHNDINI